MSQYSFIAANSIDILTINDVASRSQIQCRISLNSLNDLSDLLGYFGSGLTIAPQLEIEDVRELWSTSQPLEQKSEQEFDAFYEAWINETGRDNSMDEYGQLMQLNAFISQFNAAQYKLIAVEA